MNGPLFCIYRQALPDPGVLNSIESRKVVGVRGVSGVLHGVPASSFEVEAALGVV
jgi:hypothetical protein